MKLIYLKTLFSNTNHYTSLCDIAVAIAKKYKLQEFSFLEIGVFKADNAVSVISTLTAKKIKVNYIGFDLFDSIDYLKDKYPNDYVQYNLEEYPYWEFKSGQHQYENVVQKLSAYLPEANIKLVAGDTMVTLQHYFKTNTSKIDLIYIDGCHDYKVVKSDFANCESQFKINQNLIIVFDDYSYDGVKMLYDDICSHKNYKVTLINPNQFTVRCVNFKDN